MFHVKTPLSGSLLGQSIVEVSHSRPGDCGAALPGRHGQNFANWLTLTRTLGQSWPHCRQSVQDVGGRGVHGDQGEYRG